MMKSYTLQVDSPAVSQTDPVTRQKLQPGDQVVECHNNHVILEESWKFLGQQCPMCDAADTPLKDEPPETEHRSSSAAPKGSGDNGGSPKTPLLLTLLTIGLIACVAIIAIVGTGAIVASQTGQTTPFVIERTVVVTNPGEPDTRITTSSGGHQATEPPAHPTSSQRPTPVPNNSDESNLPSNISGGDGAPMVLIPAGDFLRGSTDSQIREAENACGRFSGCEFTNESPQQDMYLKAFYIDIYEVTEQLYYGSGGDRPVANVNHNDAERYCTTSGMRLPTEWEWEKAARGSDGRVYPWGDSYDTSRLNSNDQRSGPLQVGSYESGKSPYGLYDMAGNVWEWTASTLGGNYVIRGGSYTNPWYFVRTANRGTRSATTSSELTGFRCAQDIP